MPFAAVAGPALVALAALLLPLAGLGHRFKLWSLRVAFIVAGMAGVVAAGGTALCLLSLSQDVPRSVIATWLALGGAVVGLAALAIPARRLAVSLRVPVFHDMSTDLDDRPRFATLNPPSALKPSAEPAPQGDAAERQRRNYPDIQPLDLELPPEAAFAAVEAAALELGWDVVATTPEEGRLEATATTFWFGFSGAVVVRVRPRETGSRVDVRSVSQTRMTDLGANATRMREFLDLVGGGG